LRDLDSEDIADRYAGEQDEPGENAERHEVEIPLERRVEEARRSPRS
jgi:hypothetical protein